MNNIKIIDAIMGSGKSTYVIEEIINKNPDKKFICVVPTIDKLNEKNEVVRTGEVTRYRNAINAVTFEPKKSPFKKNGLDSLIASGYNIVTTHSLIQYIDDDTMELLKKANYTLIIDECLDVVHVYQKISKHDSMSLVVDGWISIDENGYLDWNTVKDKALFNSNYKGSWDEVKRLCNLNALMCIRKNDGTISHNIIYWHFPVGFFDLFEESYICTYLWNGSIQKAYFDMHNVMYQHLTLINHKLVDYDLKEEIETRKHLFSLINLYKEDNLNLIGTPDEKNKHPLTKEWFKKKAKAKGQYELKLLKNNVYNFFKNKAKTPANENMYTVFKSHRQYIKGVGYTKGFLPCNSKGTNEYKHKKSLAYLINLYLQPDIINFFNSQGVKINSDLWSLSELLQWIWRSGIREGKEINLYLPSKRMRGLIQKWALGII